MLATKGNILVAGEITRRYETSVFGIVRKVMEDVGFSTERNEMDALIHQQSQDIAGVAFIPRKRKAECHWGGTACIKVL